MTLHVDFKNMKHVVTFGIKLGFGLAIGVTATKTLIDDLITIEKALLDKSKKAKEGTKEGEKAEE